MGGFELSFNSSCSMSGGAEMTFNWKVKQQHKMVLTMFSPDNFHNSTKPQKTITTTTPRHLAPRQNPSITVTRESMVGSPTPSFPQVPPSPSPSHLDKWEFHSENFGQPSLAPRSSRTPPPLEKMISAPGNLQQFTHRGDKAQFSIHHFQAPPLSPTPGTPPPGTSSNDSSPREYSPPTVPARDSRRTKRESFQPPTLRTQASTPSHIHFLASPGISRNIKKKTIKPRPFLNQTKKLPSTSDLPLSFVRSSERSPEYKGEQQTRPFRPPPLLSRNSESMIEVQRVQSPSSLALPSLSCVVSGSPVESPNDSPYSSCNESDQEMREVERKTSKMSIKHLIDS